jgi:O-acetyl-ADP-ribose deacetylase (regulator of RNase III)
VWRGGGAREESLLELCYRRSFALARDARVRSIAFPAISTGAYGFPKELAARIAVRVMREHEKEFDDIVACCFSAEDRRCYEALLGG